MSSLASTQLYIRRPVFIKYFLPFFCMGWVGVALSFFKGIFTGDARWLFLLILFLFLMTRKKLARLFDKRLALLFFTYGSWCLLTSLWSIVPVLSVVKSTLFFFAICTLVFAGIEWVKFYPWQSALSYLWALAFISLLSALLGLHSPTDGNYYHGAMMTRAASNIFGFMMAASLPFFLWTTYEKWDRKAERFVWLATVAVMVFFTFFSMSRASITMVFTIMLCFFLSLQSSKKVKLLSCAIFVAVGALIFSPAVTTKLVNLVGGYVYKGNLQSSHQGEALMSIFSSRTALWQSSYVGAVEGGWSGLGFGACYLKENFNLTQGLTTAGYAREKGNSQLAIIEETGLIGFSLYLILLAYLISRFIRLYITVQSRDQRVLVAILAGSFLGMLLQSVFEGWWYAPGAPEFGYFWLLVGIMRGIEVSISHGKWMARVITAEVPS